MGVAPRSGQASQSPADAYFNSIFCQSPRIMASRISDGFFPCLCILPARRTSLRQIIQPAE